MSAISTLLSRGDYSEKARFLFEKLTDSRFDPQSLLDDLPALLHLVGELSRSDMKDGGLSSPWFTEQAARIYLDFLGVSRERWSVLHWLPRGGSTTYNFPIGSLPLHVLSGKELISPKYFASPGVDLVGNRTMLVLHAIDYWYVGFAFLPLVDLGSASTVSTSWTSSSTHTKWYDEAKSGSIYSQLLDQYVDALDKGGMLIVALWTDFLLNPMLYTSTVLNYKKLFGLISVVATTLWTEHRAHPLCGQFHEKLNQLLFDLFSPSSFASKFIHRIDIACCASLIKLWRGQVDRLGARDSRLCQLAILQSGPIIDFISDTETAFSPPVTASTISSLQNTPETKLAVSAILNVLEVADTIDDDTSASAWEMCRLCTWHAERVPKNLYDESMRMDVLVKKHPSIFSWDKPKSNTSSSQNGIPRSVSVIPKEKRSGSSVTVGSVTWATPPSAQEVAVVIVWLKWLVELVSGKSVGTEEYVSVRKLANVHVLFIIFFISWLYLILTGAFGVGTVICLPVMIIVGTKAVVAQYIV